MVDNIHEGYKMTPLGEIPEDWEVVRLNDCADIRLSNVDKKIAKGELLVLLCNYLEVYKNEYIIGSMPFMVGSAKREEIEKFRVFKDDVIITKDSEEFNDIAKPAYVAEEIDNLICGYHLAMLRPKDDISGLFLSKALQLHNVNIFFQNRANGITRFGISKNTIETALIPLSPLPEQRRIAAILSTVDETIEHTGALIEKYRNIKKGLMTDLLTRGIDEEGKIRSDGTHRFKDSALGRVPEEWIIVKLGDATYFELATGGTPSTAVPEYWNGDIPWLVSGDVHNKIIYCIEGRISKLGYQNSNATIHPKQSVLIALAGQGKTRGTIAISEIELTTNQSVAAIIPQKNLVASYYLYHFLDSKYIELRSISAGAGRAGLSLTILKNYEFPLPPPSEQYRIAEILSSVDKRIKKEEAYREKLLQMKKGLMQDLLTGRVRVG
jgi:type I restriction enzyme S subunit